MNRDQLATKIAGIIGGQDYREKMLVVAELAGAKLAELGDMTIEEFMRLHEDN